MSNAPQRKPYRKPCLKKLGDLRSLTLGGSAGAGDSGGSLTHKVKLGLPQPAGIPRPDGGIRLPDGSILMPDGRILPPG